MKSPVYKLVLISFSLVCLVACGSNLDISGRGANAGCLYLVTDSLKISYTCDKRMIAGITVLFEGLSYNGRDSVYLRATIEEPVRDYVLPVSREALNSHPVKISLRVTDSHWRESYYIWIKPGDLDKKTKIGARYFRPLTLFFTVQLFRYC
jgi:hypothetical protein